MGSMETEPRDREVIIPWLGTCPYRSSAVAHVAFLYGRSGFPLNLAIDVAERCSGGFCKAALVMPAAAASTASTVAVADADVWCDGLAEAFEAVESGEAAWAIPHEKVFRLSQAASVEYQRSAYYEGSNFELKETDLEQRPYMGIPGGGLVVISREALLDVPLDPRFIGWGDEDSSWGFALEVLLGKPWRGTADLIHFWHPPQERQSRRRGNESNAKLRHRYFMATNYPHKMRAIVEEAKEALCLTESS